MLPHPGRIGIELKVDLPRPRDQVATRESPEFLALRRALYDFIHTAERGRSRRDGGAKRRSRRWRCRRRLADPRRNRRARWADRAIPSRRRRPRRSRWSRRSRDGSLLEATRDTLLSAFGGLAIGAGLGLVLGILLGSVRTLDRLMELTIELLRPIPSVAVIPVALVALGFGYRLEDRDRIVRLPVAAA